MDELQPNAKALLRQARASVSPSAREVAELHDRLASTPLPPEPEGPGPGAAEAGAANWSRYVVIAAIVGGVVAAVMLSARPPAPQAHLDPLGLVPRPAIAAEPEVAIEPRLWAATPSEPPPVETSAASVEPPPKSPPQPKRQKQARPRRAPSRGDGLSVELALITRARRALAADDPSTARSVAREYLRRFPKGSFLEEADVLEIVADCSIARSTALESRARAYVDREQGAFARRVRKACLAPR